MTVIAAGKHAPGIGWHQVGMSDCLLLVTRLFYTPGSWTLQSAQKGRRHVEWPVVTLSKSVMINPTGSVFMTLAGTLTKSSKPVFMTAIALKWIVWSESVTQNQSILKQAHPVTPKCWAAPAAASVSACCGTFSSDELGEMITNLPDVRVSKAESQKPGCAALRSAEDPRSGYVWARPRRGRSQTQNPKKKKRKVTCLCFYLI